MYRKYIKRILDVIFSFLLLILLSPVLLFIGILVRINLGKPVFFRQPRPGKDEVIFNMLKFRTMKNTIGLDGELLPDKERITKFGKFLRFSSLDELPELWCILKGEMSFVGPRPLSVKYLPFYDENESRRHTVAPGLTGLAQVSGRNRLDWDYRLKLDVEYVDTISFLNDISIIIKTIKIVISKEDVVISGTGKVGDLDEIREVRRPNYKQ